MQEGGFESGGASSGTAAGVLTIPEGRVLSAVVQPQCSLAVQLRRVTESVVGRPVEIAAIRQEVADAKGRLGAITLEGEPGIGKTRLLVAAADIAATAGFTAVAITADEEIRGPFLLAQSLFASPALRDGIAGTNAEGAVQRAVDAITGREEPGLVALAPDQKLLRAFDLAAVALSAVAAQRPVALLIDDVQWADDDTLRMLRYTVRSNPSSPILLLLAIRPDEFALVTEAVNLVADMERMGVVRRIKLGRFSAMETGELVRQVLGGGVHPESIAAMHAQSEGVPFIVEELGRTYRDAGMIQEIDGVWKLAKNAERLVPSAVRTLIQRRAARLPEETRRVLSDAAVLGRSFSLRDLRVIRQQLDGTDADGGSEGDALRPAVAAGLLIEQGEGAPADYTFTHEQVREFAAAGLSQTRRRAIHGAIVDMLSAGGDPPSGSLPLLAHHALAAGDAARAARFSIQAAKAAMQSNAPEEVLRLVDRALPVVSAPQDRLELLVARDDAYAMLRRPVDRLEGLAELAALAEALGDSHFELEFMLRRAAALRLAEENDVAADLARRVRKLAAAREDDAAELAACLELAQALLGTSLGETYSPTTSEHDVDGAEEALNRAVAIAQQLGDEGSLAAATRELGTIMVSRIRDWFVEEVRTGRHIEYMKRVQAGEALPDILPTLPIAPQVGQAMELYQRALGIYERLGDRRGVMSTVIAMAYITYAPVIHISSSGRHIEEIRRLTSRLDNLTTESERARNDLQMLFGVHLYARAKIVPDLVLSRGEEAYRQARVLGDRLIEFHAAGGLALAHLDMGEVEEAERWLDRAAAAASAAPTPVKARYLELWRGTAKAAAGDATAMRSHFERAVKMATEQGKPAARCEALARLALEAGRLGAASGDEELLQAAETAAFQAKEVVGILPGHAPYGAQADAAIAEVSMAQGDGERAVMAAASVVQQLREALNEDANLDVVLPAAKAIFASGPEEMQAFAREWLQLQLRGIVQRTLDEDVRVRWLRGPVGRELVRLAGALAPIPSGDGQGAHPNGLAEDEHRILSLLTEGRTNREIAEELDSTEDAVTRRLAEIFAKIGVSSRAEATSFAFQENMR
ncbi:MAG: AAA family ATPase [Actinomycetota bacterium]